MSRPSPEGSLPELGHHFLVGLQPSPRLTEHDERLLGELRPAGVVLFRDNFAHDLPYDGWLEQLDRLLADVRSRIGRDRLLVCIDHEGGPVLRTPAPITAFAAARSWASRSAEVGRAMGRELSSIGVNVDFAPVADVHLHPENPIIGRRAFGSEPRAVAEAAGRFLEGLESAGVLGCAKHFPGHGATTGDSHEELPVLDVTLEDLRSRELVPFASLIAQGVRMVMTAHILFPRLDPELPATLSATILRDLLRRELGFGGVVVSDDVGMKAVADRFADPSTAARAIAAGCDLIALCAHLADTGKALDLVAALRAARRSGALGEDVLARSSRRIRRLLEEAPQHGVRKLPADLLAAHAAIAESSRQQPS